MNDRRQLHELHDLELVARAAAGDLAASEAMAGRDLLASCDSCASVAADLRAIASATCQLPTAAARSAVVSAPRDFRLTAADAARLRPGGLKGLRHRLGCGSSFGGRARGLGGALATLGLVGLLVSVGIPGLSGGAGASAGATLPNEDAVGKGSAPIVPVMVPAATYDSALFATDDPSRELGESPASGVTSSNPWALAVGVSLGVLAVGIALILIGWRAPGRVS